MSAFGDRLMEFTQGRSKDPWINSDGTKVAFESSSDLVGQNPEGNFEIFLFDVNTQSLLQVTSAAQGDSRSASLTDAGDRIVFHSNADLTGQNPEKNFETFLFETATRKITQLTRSTSGESTGPSIDGAGTRIVFQSTANLTGGNPSGKSEIFQYQVSGASLSQVTSGGGRDSRDPFISGDGRRIVFASSSRSLTSLNADGNQEIFAFDTATQAFTQISNSTGPPSQTPAANRDGTRIVFVSQANLTGANPDLNGEIFLYDTAAGSRRQISSTPDKRPDGFTSNVTYFPAISADGRWVSYMSTANQAGKPVDAGYRNVFLFDSQGGTTTQISRNPDLPFFPGASNRAALSADGKVIALESVFDYTGQNPLGSFELFLFDVNKNSFSQITKTSRLSFNVSVSADGDRIAFDSDLDLTGENADRNNEIFLFNAASATYLQLTKTTKPGFSNSGAVISGDGKRVLFRSTNDITGKNPAGASHLFLSEVESKVITQLTEGSLSSVAGSINHDGSRVALTSTANFAGKNADGSSEVFLMNVDTRSFTQVTDTSTGSHTGLFLSPDGRWLVFASTADLTGKNSDANREIFLFDAQNGLMRQITETTGVGFSANTAPTVSADGSKIAFRSRLDLVGKNADGNEEIFLFDTQAGRFTQVTHSTGFTFSDTPFINRAGTRILFTSAVDLTGQNPNKTDQVFLFDLAAGGLIQLGENTGLLTLGGISADGAVAALQGWFSTGPFDLTIAGVIDASDRDVRAGILRMTAGLYFAQFGEGAGLLFSQALFFNLQGNGEATVRVELKDDDGKALKTDLNGQAVEGSTQVKVPPSGLRLLRTDGKGPLLAGSVKVLADRSVAGVVLFGGGVGLAGVGSSSAQTTGFVAGIERRAADAVDTGVAVMNLSIHRVTLSLRLSDPDGKLLASAQASLNGMGHLARFVTQFSWDKPVDFSNFQGLLKVTSDRPIAATVIQTRPGEFVTMPVAARTGPSGSSTPAAAGELGQKLYFAQFGEGLDLLSSQIFLFNLDESMEATARLVLRGDGGSPLSVDLNGETIAGEKEVKIPASGLRIFRTDGKGPLLAGSVTVLSDKPLAGVILFAGAVGAAGVGTSAELGKGFAAPMESNRQAGVQTGVAVMNLETNSVTVDLSLLDSEGKQVATGKLVLDPLGHAARFLDQISWSPNVDFSQFQGVLRATVSGKIAATVIQTRPGQFATMPVAATDN